MENDRTTEIRQLLAEADIITRTRKPSTEQKLRHAYLLAKVSQLRSEGTTATDEYRAAQLRKELVNVYRQIAQGVPIEEIRANQAAGGAVITYSNASGSSFVPVQFMLSGLQVGVAQHDALFDSDKVTVINTPKGGPLSLPLISDVSVKAVPVEEAVNDDSYTNLAALGAAQNETHMYRTDKFAISREFNEDGGELALQVLENAFAQRIARGVGADLVSGTGTDGHIKGLIPQLQTLGVLPITAAGSEENTGVSTDTGSNSIGSRDLMRLYKSVNAAFRASSKCAFLMNDDTLLSISAMVDKYGQRMRIVEYVNGEPFILGKPVYVSPSCPDVAPSAAGVVIFGDLSRWLTRGVTGDGRIQVYTETEGLAEKGLIGLACFARYGGALLTTDSANSPINYLEMHS